MQTLILIAAYVLLLRPVHRAFAVGLRVAGAPAASRYPTSFTFPLFDCS